MPRSTNQILKTRLIYRCTCTNVSFNFCLPFGTFLKVKSKQPWKNIPGCVWYYVQTRNIYVTCDRWVEKNRNWRNHMGGLVWWVCCHLLPRPCSSTPDWPWFWIGAGYNNIYIHVYIMICCWVGFVKWLQMDFKLDITRFDGFRLWLNLISRLARW